VSDLTDKEPTKPLVEIGELELCGEKIKLGKNGHVRLVRESVDAWGNKYGVELDLYNWLTNGGEELMILPRAQALLDELGKALMGFNLSKDRT
jgi:hypothetical protein